MRHVVEVRQVEARPIAVVRGSTPRATLPQTIRALFDEFYKSFQGKAGLNIVHYPLCENGVLHIECGVQVECDGNSATPAGTVATTTYFGPYDRMGPAHEAIHHWCREQGRALAGALWEVYGHWTDDPAQRRTDIYYLLKD